MSALSKKIHKLPRKHLNLLSDDKLTNVQTYLSGLYKEFGVDVVLRSLCKYWSLNEAINYFSKVKKHIIKKENVQTIAVCVTAIDNGGVARVAASLIDLWINMGYKVVLITSRPESPYDFKYNDKAKRYVIPPVNKMRDRLTKLKKICIEEHVDLYVNNLWLIERAVWEIALLNELNITYVIHSHGAFNYIFNYPPHKYLQPSVCRLSDAMIAISEDAGYTFYKELGCNVFLVNNPLPKDLLNRPRCNIDSKRILLMGRVSFEKHPIAALKVFRKVHKVIPDSYLDVVGSQNPLLKFAMNVYIGLHGLSRSVKLYGQKNSQEAQRFYLQSSCMLFTSTSEGYPMVLLEAKSFGLPVAMYNLDYLTMVKGYKGIAVAQLKDTEGLADAVISMLKDKNHRQKMSDDSYNNFLDFANYDLANAWKQVINGVKNDFVYDNQTTSTKLLLNNVIHMHKKSLFCRFVRLVDRIFNKS